MTTFPKITVVTPSYNQGQFLEETIQSVLGQCYPNLEYIIMDGGSTDDSVAIIKKYEKHLAYWTSGPDGGQSAAINAGFARSTGNILCWLNSDDTYLPGALKFVAAQLEIQHPEVMFGNSVHIFDGTSVCYGSDVVSQHKDQDMRFGNYIVQPSAFWTRRAWETSGLLAEELYYSMDWDWFLKANAAGVAFHPVVRYLSVYRIHSSHKSSTGGAKRQSEIAYVYEKHFGIERKNLYLECCRAADNVNRFDKLLVRLHMSRASRLLLPRRFPNLFGKYSQSEIRQILSMR